MKRIIIASIMSLVAFSAKAQVIGGTVDISVPSGSGSTAALLPASTSKYPKLLIIPGDGTATEVRWTTGTSSLSPATSTSPPLPAGGICYSAGASNNYISMYGATATATVHVTQITGCPEGIGFAGGSGGGGGSGGNVSIVSPVDGSGNVKVDVAAGTISFTWPGTAAVTSYGTAPTGTVPAVNANVTNSITTTLSAVGTSGGATTAPSTAIEIAGITAGGNLQTPIITATQSLKVTDSDAQSNAGTSNGTVVSVQGNVSGIPIPVNQTQIAGVGLGSPSIWGAAPSSYVQGVNANVLVSVLPSGAATSALQTAGNTTLTTINTTLGSPMQNTGGTVTAIQATAANLNMTCANCSSSGGGTDGGTFTAGSSTFSPNGGVYQTTVTSNPLTAGKWGVAQFTQYRAIMSDWYNSSGVEMGNSTTPVYTTNGAIGTAGSSSPANGLVGGGVTGGGLFEPFIMSATQSLKVYNGDAQSSIGGSSTSILNVQGNASGTPMPVICTSGCSGGGGGGSGGSTPQTTLSNQVNVSSSGTSVIVTHSGSTLTYVTQVGLVSAGNTNFSLEYGSGTNCGTGTTVLDGALPGIAQFGIQKGTGFGSVYVPIPVGDDVCLVNSASIAVTGSIGFTQSATTISSFGGGGGTSGFVPTPSYASLSFSDASNHSVAVPTGTDDVITNLDTTIAYCNFGAASTTSTFPITAGAAYGVHNGSAFSTIQCQSPNSTLNIRISGGAGLFSGGGGGGGGGSGGGCPGTTSTPCIVAPNTGAVFQVALNGSNTVAVSGLTPSTNSVPINISTATTTQLVALSGTTSIYVTSWDIMAAGTGNITLEYGTGSACATGTTVLTGAYPMAAQVVYSKGSGIAPVLVVPAGNALCALTSAAVQMSGSLSYTQF